MKHRHVPKRYGNRPMGPPGRVAVVSAPVAAVVLSVLLPAAPALAVGTLAGTTITNQAEVSFTIDGADLSLESNVASMDVAEVIDLDLLVQTPQQLVFGGATDQPILLTLSNVGNGSEVFTLDPRYAITGDDFDPLAGTPAIWFDIDGDGSLTAADQPYQPGANDPLLAADESISLFVLGDIPGTVADGDIGLVELAVTADSGSGTPGQSLPGLGDGGVDAVIGTSGGQAIAGAEYLVGQVSLSLIKSAAVRDPDGGSLPVPGAAIDYTVQVSATGTGSATDALFIDPIPPGTTFAAGSIRVNGIPQTDGQDADPGHYEAAPASVRVALGSVAPGGAAQQISFTVTIN